MGNKIYCLIFSAFLILYFVVPKELIAINFYDTYFLISYSSLVYYLFLLLVIIFSVNKVYNYMKKRSLN
jgi:hypothetical protein